MLGFGFHRRDGEVRIRIAPKAQERMHQRARKLTARTWGVAMEERVKLLNRYLTGWGSYFRLAETCGVQERGSSPVMRSLMIASTPAACRHPPRPSRHDRSP